MRTVTQARAVESHDDDWGLESIIMAGKRMPLEQEDKTIDSLASSLFLERVLELWT